MGNVIYVREVSKEQKHSLKRLAKKNNQSIQGYMLTIIGNLTSKEISEFKNNKK